MYLVYTSIPSEEDVPLVEFMYLVYNTRIPGEEDVPVLEFMYLVFTRKPGESYRRRLRSLLLYLCYVFRALINSLVCWTLGTPGYQMCRLNDVKFWKYFTYNIAAETASAKVCSNSRSTELHNERGVGRK